MKLAGCVRWLLPACLASTALPAPAAAYTIGTSFTSPCHEELTLEALSRVTLPSLAVRYEEGARWPRVAAHVARQLDRDAGLDPAADATLLAALLGVRWPDLEGASPAHLAALRHVHLSDDAQARHFLRRSDHDLQTGNPDAVRAAQDRLRLLLTASAEAYARDPDGRLLEPVPVWLEGYGTTEVEVWMPLYLLGQALHLVQDSFAHTYRSDDGRSILAVQNYVEAVGGEYEVDRDGPRHSIALDACTDRDTAPLVEAATQASSELVEMAMSYWTARDEAVVATFIDRWLALDETCLRHACTSRWVDLAQRAETHALLSCRAAPGRGAVEPPMLVLLASAVLTCRVRRNRRGGLNERAVHLA